MAHGGGSGALRGALRPEATRGVLRRRVAPPTTGGRDAHALLANQALPHPARYDYEYERRGTVNIFAFFEPKRGWRHLDTTDRRTAVDFALVMRRLVNEHYPDAQKVLDGPRQPQHPQHRSGALPGFRARGGEAHLAPVGVVPLHAQARLLARPGGGDRVVGAFAAVLGASYPRRRDACEGGDRGMGTGAQRRRGDGAVALHGVGSSGEAGMPLPGTIIVVEY